MKLKNNFIVLILVASMVPQFISFAQSSTQNPAMNHIYLELFGSGIFYSANFERYLSEDLTLRAGFGLTPGLIFVDGTFIQIPVSFSYLIGGISSKFEIGLGGTYFGGSETEVFGLPVDDQSILYLTGIFGYRYISTRGFVFRITFTPFYNPDSDPEFIPSGGISFGYAFN